MEGKEDGKKKKKNFTHIFSKQKDGRGDCDNVSSIQQGIYFNKIVKKKKNVWETSISTPA